MTYSLNSDIYHGDVSSQVYEFHLKPRPCIFIHVEKADLKNNVNYRFWKTGQVISSIEELDDVLLNIDNGKEPFLEVQKQFFNENFLTDEKNSASEKGAKAILNFFQLQSND